MNKNILKDMLGEDGQKLLKKMKKNRDKTLKKEKRKIDAIYDACDHFEVKMNKSRKRLKDAIKNSNTKTYATKQYSWKADYEALRKQSMMT